MGKTNIWQFRQDVFRIDVLYAETAILHNRWNATTSFGSRIVFELVTFQ